MAAGVLVPDHYGSANSLAARFPSQWRNAVCCLPASANFCWMRRVSSFWRSGATNVQWLVVSRLHGDFGLQNLFLALHGSNLRAPSLKDASPREEFLVWHRNQVFRGVARDLS
jgi:hypothetical protein